MDPSIIKPIIAAWELHRSEAKKLNKKARTLLNSGDREQIRIGTELLDAAAAHEKLAELILTRLRIAGEIIFTHTQVMGPVADWNTKFRIPQLRRLEAEFEIIKRHLWSPLTKADLDLAGLLPGSYMRNVIESASSMRLDAGELADEIYPIPEKPLSSGDQNSRQFQAGERLYIVLEEIRRVLYRAESGQYGTGEVRSPLSPTSDGEEIELAHKHVELKRIMKKIWMEKYPNLPLGEELYGKIIEEMDARLSDPNCSQEERNLHVNFLEEKYFPEHQDLDEYSWKVADDKRGKDGDRTRTLRRWIARALEQGLPPDDKGKEPV